VFSLLLFVIVGAFGGTMLISYKRHPREKGANHIYTSRCGGEFGLIKLSVPFIRLSLYDDFLVISHWTRTVLEYKHIRSLEKYGLFGDGILIMTTNIEKYGQPIIWSYNHKKLLEFLKKKITHYNNAYKTYG